MGEQNSSGCLGVPPTPRCWEGDKGGGGTTYPRKAGRTQASGPPTFPAPPPGGPRRPGPPNLCPYIAPGRGRPPAALRRLIRARGGAGGGGPPPRATQGPPGLTLPAPLPAGGGGGRRDGAPSAPHPAGRLQGETEARQGRHTHAGCQVSPPPVPGHGGVPGAHRLPARRGDPGARVSPSRGSTRDSARSCPRPQPAPLRPGPAPPPRLRLRSGLTLARPPPG